MTDDFRPLSASAITTYLDCHRKWAFKYILGLPDPPGPDAQKGVAVHKILETYQNTGVKPLEGTPPEDPNFVAWSGVPYITPGHGEAEGEHTFEIDGIKFVVVIDYNDLTAPIPKLRDWKTTGKLSNAKKASDLRKDVQATLYSEWALQKRPDADVVDLEWIYIQTKENVGRTKLVTLRKSRLDQAETLPAILHVAKEIDSRRRTEYDVAGFAKNLKACYKFNGCPFRAQCTKVDMSSLKNLVAQQVNPPVPGQLAPPAPLAAMPAPPAAAPPAVMPPPVAASTPAALPMAPPDPNPALTAFLATLNRDQLKSIALAYKFLEADSKMREPSIRTMLHDKFSMYPEAAQNLQTMVGASPPSPAPATTAPELPPAAPPPVAPAAPPPAAPAAPALPDAEVAAAIPVFETSEIQASVQVRGFTLYINCYPLKGGEEVVNARQYLDPAFRKAGELSGYGEGADYRLAEFGKGAGYLATAVSAFLNDRLADLDGKAVYLDARGQEGGHLVETLQLLATRVIRGM